MSLSCANQPMDQHVLNCLTFACFTLTSKVQVRVMHCSVLPSPCNCTEYGSKFAHRITSKTYPAKEYCIVLQRNIYFFQTEEKAGIWINTNSAVW